MSLDELKELAEFYGVTPAALLMDPEVANKKITRMQRAAHQAERMTDEVAETWLQMGEMVSPKGTGE